MTELKKQTFPPEFMRTNRIFGSLIAIKSTSLITLLDLSAKD